VIEKDRREIKVKKMTPEKKGGPGVRLGVHINYRTGAGLRARERRSGEAIAGRRSHPGGAAVKRKRKSEA